MKYWPNMAIFWQFFFLHDYQCKRFAVAVILYVVALLVHPLTFSDYFLCLGVNPDKLYRTLSFMTHPVSGTTW